MNKSNINQALRESGLTEKEIRIYVYLAKNGLQRGGNIAKGTKIDRSVVYRILRRLQKKGFIEATLESPTQFGAVSFAKALDIVIKIKEEEANQLRKAKKTLLKEWRLLSANSSEISQETFVVIQDTKKIFDKMLQMMIEAHIKFYCLLPISDLFKAEQIGIFDWVSNRASKSNVSYEFITEIASENTNAVIILESKLGKNIQLNLVRRDSNLNMFPRIAIKDDDEILFFTTANSRSSKEEVAISTNCESLVQTFKRIYQEIAEHSSPLETNINAIKDGKIEHISILNKTLTFQGSDKFIDFTDNDSINQENESTYDFTSQMKSLTSEENEVLECASIIGEKFSLEILERITNIHRIRLLKMLINIETKSRIIISSGNNFKFFDSSVRNNLLKNINPKLKKTYHALTAQYFEDSCKNNLEDFPKELAYHYFNSDNIQKAIPYLLRTGNDYQRKLNFSEAINNYSLAIEMIGSDIKWDTQKTIILENLGDAYGSIGEHENANKCYNQALSITDNKQFADRVRRKIRKKIVAKKGKMNFNYYVYGQGEPTLLLIWTSIHFMPQIHYFAQKQKVAVLDLEDLWDFKDSPTEHTLDLYTENLHAIIEDLNDKNLSILGIALGGTLAILHEAKYPHSIAKLALLATPPKSPISGSNDKKKFFEEFWATALQSPLWGTKELYKRIIQPAWPVYKSNDKISSRIRLTTAKTSLEMRLIAFKILSETDVESLLDKITIPTLILHGEKDILPIKAVKLMNKKIINSNLVIFDNAKGISLSEPEKFNEVLEKFLISHNDH